MLQQEFKAHTYDWAVARMRCDPNYIERPMFGCRACYLNGELKLILADSGEEPWNGVMIATDRENHSELMKEFPALKPHPVLGKWLYLSESHERFETVLLEVEKIILRGDNRIGVVPSERKSKRKIGKKKIGRSKSQ